MKNIFLWILAGLLVVSQIISGCSVAGSAISAGEDAVKEKKYDVAIEKGVAAVKADPEEPEDGYQFLNMHYDNAISHYTGIAEAGKAGNSVDLKVSAFEAYKSLQRITKAIKSIKVPYTNPDPENAFTFNPTVKNYTSQIESARKEAAEAYYQAAVQLSKSPQWETQKGAISYLNSLTKLWGKSYKKHKNIGAEINYQRALELEKQDNRKAYREAASNFTSALNWVANYKDSKKRLEEANRKAFITFYVFDEKKSLGQKGADAVASFLGSGLGKSFKNFNDRNDRSVYSKNLMSKYPVVSHVLKQSGYSTGSWASAVAGAKKMGLNYIVFVKSVKSTDYNQGSKTAKSKTIEAKDEVALDKYGKVVKDSKGKPIFMNFLYRKRQKQLDDSNAKLVDQSKKQYIDVKGTLIYRWAKLNSIEQRYEITSTLNVKAEFAVFDVNAGSVIDTVIVEQTESGTVSWLHAVHGNKEIYKNQIAAAKRSAAKGKKPYTQSMLFKQALKQIPLKASSALKPGLQAVDI